MGLSSLFPPIYLSNKFISLNSVFRLPESFLIYYRPIGNVNELKNRGKGSEDAKRPFIAFSRQLIFFQPEKAYDREFAFYSK
jgi:hypothetical protein